MMMKLGKKIAASLGTLCLAVILMFTASASAAQLFPFEPDSETNWNILRVGDYAYSTLTVKHPNI
ncbi:hypothetical protein PCURB6_42240 [Paenibacillus curdlanolyticus]|nr:hypothetical protein [Paenibacillus curdlanolyticus]GFN33964.1 hypothetical protein PCURB6_42240 [Paenibacillus curdlanolyticus]